MIYHFTMPQDKKPTAVNKNRTASVAAEDINEKKMKKNMFKFNNVILQVLKQVHPNIPITCGALEVMNTIITNMMLKLVQKSFKHSLHRDVTSQNCPSRILMLLLWKSFLHKWPNLPAKLVSKLEPLAVSVD
jgi:hypothetical protein